MRFEQIQKEHEQKYQGILQNVIQQGVLVEKQPEAGTSVEGAAGGESGEPGEVELTTVESVEKLGEQDPIEARCMSEVSGIEILVCKSGKCYLVSSKARILPKGTLMGAFGAGKFLAIFLVS